MEKLSVCIEMIFKELPLAERIRKVAEAGFPAFEFWGWSDKDLDALRKAQQQHGLEVGAFCVETGGPLVDPATTLPFVKGVDRAMELAHQLGCKTLIVTTGNERPDLPRPKQHDAIVESLRKAAPLAESGGITLVLEPLNILVDHAGYYLHSSAEGFEIVREVNSPNVRLLYDIYHQQITEGNLIQTITSNIDLIGYFHSADVPGRHQFGTGEINYRGVIRAIRHAGYQGYIGLEFTPTHSAEAALAQVKEHLGLL